MLVTKIVMIAALLALPVFSQTSSSAVDPEKIIEVNTRERNLSTKPVNKVCPVKDEEINQDSPLLIFSRQSRDGLLEEKIIGFGCEDCIDAFIKNPQAYLKRLKRSIG